MEQLGCNPMQQALDRALNETEEEWREKIAKPLDKVDTNRLIQLINGHLGQ